MNSISSAMLTFMLTRVTTKATMLASSSVTITAGTVISTELRKNRSMSLWVQALT